MKNWQPIETAPLRDAVIVHHDAYWTRLACRHEDGTFWPWPRQSGDECLSYSPTHWAPLPEPPAAKGRRMKIKLGAWKYQGRGIDYGRVIYNRSRKWWLRIGPYILYVEQFA